MKKSHLLLFVFLLPYLASAQFEQKISINLSAGMFKTFGKKTQGEYNDPLQMPNYKMGLGSNLGLQFNLNRHLSLVTDFGIMYSPGWSYRVGSNDNYLHYTIFDSLETYYGEGTNYLNLLSLNIGITPKYYLFADKKWKPYFFAGVNINFTSAKFTNNQWQAAHDFGILSSNDTGPYNNFLERNVGLGFSPGIGVEFEPNDKLAFFLSSGYYMIMMNKKNFKSEYLKENFNALFLQVGVRFSFLKSKDL